MRVKWNRNLDGIRPLITVPETDVISDCKLEEVDNFDKKSFNDFNENKTDSEVIDKTVNITDNIIDSVRAQSCESPSPSSASITSRRSDKSKPRISSLFGLFKVKDKVISDNNNEDSVSNFSELSGATIPSLINPSLSKRKSSYGSRDSMLSIHEKIGFEADTRRRRRANSLLARTSLRRSWQQLNATNKLPIGSTYIITKERLPNHCLIASHSPLLIRHNSSEQDLTTTRSSQIRPKSDLLPEDSPNYENVSQVSTEQPNIETETNERTGSHSNGNHSSVDEINGKEVENNSILVIQTDVQTVKSKAICISESDLYEKNSGCDGVDNKVQSVVNSLDSEQNLLNNSKMIFDPKNSFKYIKNEPKPDSHKIDANFSNSVTKNGVQQNRICVSEQNINISDTDILINEKPKTEETTETTPQLNSKPNDEHLKNIPNSDVSNEFCVELSLSQTNEQIIQSNDTSISCKSINLGINGCANNIIKVKVKKNQLPESEVVCFSSQIVSSPSTVSTTNSDNECNNDRAVVLTFINDEPMTSTDRAVDKENIKSDIFVKSAPIQGILRVRSKDSNSEPNKQSSNGLANKVNGKSQKKVHFADNCLHYRNSSHSRSRSVKPRHYSSLGTIRTIRTNL